jgi:glucan biosynthesis protein C
MGASLSQRSEVMTTSSINAGNADAQHSVTQVQSSPGARLFFVDNLRILLIVLLILYHAAITYVAPGYWYYSETPSSEFAVLVLSLFTGVTQPFFLAFFMMISGYFTPGSYDRKGPGSFFKDRLLRLGIPLVFYAIVIDPLIKYAVAVNVEGFGGSLWEFLTGYVGDYHGLSIGPLWFVETLLIFSGAYALWRLATPAPAVRQHTDSSAPGNLAIAGFALLLGVVTFAVRIWLPVGWWFGPLQLPASDMPQYIALFIVGVVAYRRNWFMQISKAKGRLWLGVAIAAVVLQPIVWGVAGVFKGDVAPLLGGVHWQSLVFSVWQQFLCMGMVIGLLVLFRERLNHQGSLSKAMAASAYTVYIIHAPVLVFLSLAFQSVETLSLIKFALIAPIAVALCFLLAGVVRKLPLARDIL